MQVYACQEFRRFASWLLSKSYLASCDNIFYLFMQGEMNQLRDKLAIAERAARSEAQLKVH
jgi:hypothetical protein